MAMFGAQLWLIRLVYEKTADALKDGSLSGAPL